MTDRRVLLDRPLAQHWQLLIPTPILTDILPILNRDGGVARLVGGTVRDALLGIPPRDMDIATTLRFGAVLSRLSQIAGLQGLSPNSQHGTVRFRYENHAVTIASLRRDVATDGRRARIVYVTDWRQDAARRDFTLNALYGGADGRLYDPLGDGMLDLSAGRVRFIGNAAKRVREDCLRILRFFRFFAHYAKTDIDPDGMAAARTAGRAEPLRNLAAVHLRHELFGLLRGVRANAAIGFMQEAGLLDTLIGPTLAVSTVATNLTELARRAPEQALAHLIPPQESRLQAVARRLNLSKRQSRRFFDRVVSSRP